MPKRKLAGAAALALIFAVPAHAEVPPTPAPKPKPVKSRIQKLPPIPAKELFKAASRAAAMPPAVYGFYTRGCLAGAKQLAADGPTWQAMRLSRNRRWGHPITIALIKRLANDAKKNDGWPGLLVGDIAMPRGGPMPPAHASHQVGLDIDIWLTPMPDHRLSSAEREKLSATFMLTKNQLAVNRKVWTPAHARLIKRAASYPEVQRVLVHPAIKKELCRTAGRDRDWLSKVRPVRGHNYHFHVRLSCPPGNPGCRSQPAPRNSDGCGKELKRWYRWLHARLRPKPKPKKPRRKWKPRPPMTMAALPAMCRKVLTADDPPLPARGKRAQRPTATNR
jgi:penicillin-insensitive murein endopeptidase